MRRKRDKKAQSTLEYILILSAVVALIIVGAATMIKPGVEKALDNADNAITDAASKF